MGDKYRILIVDDEPDFVEALRRTLEAKSYRVATASTKAQAQEAIWNAEFDAVILGTIAPRGEAFAFHQWLRRSPRARDLPLMVIDAPQEKRLLKGWRVDEGMRMEADDYLAKPVEPAVLVPRIEKLLEAAVERIKVLVVDDHTVVREGICAVLSLQKDMEVVGEAVDGREAVQKATLLAPDVVLMDIVMPLMSGLEATKEIRQRCPKSRVLILTQFDDRDNFVTAGQVGACGFIPKRAASAQLLDGIRSVHKGLYFHEPIVAA